MGWLLPLVDQEKEKKPCTDQSFCPPKSQPASANVHYAAAAAGDLRSEKHFGMVHVPGMRSDAVGEEEERKGIHRCLLQQV